VLKVGGDEVYSNVTVTSVSVTDIYFTHANGIGNAKNQGPSTPRCSSIFILIQPRQRRRHLTAAAREILPTSATRKPHWTTRWRGSVSSSTGR